MTNGATCDEKPELRLRHDFSHPSDPTPLAGNISAIDRFPRSAYYSALLPMPKTQRQAVAVRYPVNTPAAIAASAARAARFASRSSGAPWPGRSR